MTRELFSYKFFIIKYCLWRDRQSLGYRYKKHYWFIRSWHSETPNYHHFGLGILGLQFVISILKGRQRNTKSK